ncbi:MAG: hypothetical protein KKE50_03060 [Nanoarchaeota archaeon]|nr:hypothetical protein [Nanoarchaeota archaeon]
MKNEKILVGRCDNASRNGKYYFGMEFPRVGVWDCSDCTITHTMCGAEGRIRENFEELKSRFE